ncbi:MAG: assimilatory sulfite reductase (NADPH) flavoprotein subunit, partial [Thermoguttaceae bacterium]
MSTTLLTVENSPFNAEQISLLNQLTTSLSPEQSIWLTGYLQGIRAQLGQQSPGASQPPATSAAPSTGPEVTVLFGSQTGNAMRLAGSLSRRLQQAGLKVTTSCMSEFRTNKLKKIQNLLVIVSTHGEGDPPDKAKLFHEYIHTQRAPKLSALRFSVLALGDQSYKNYCQTGKDFDSRFEALGASRLFERVDCDVDFRDSAEAWMQGVATVLTAETGVPTKSSTVGGASLQQPDSQASNAFDREHPFEAQVLENLCLNGRGSDKETRYLKLSLEGSGLSFEPGDSLGIFPQNNAELVDALIKQMQWNSDEPVPAGKAEMPLRDALLKHYEITLLTRPLLEKAAEFSRDGLHDLVHNRPEDDLYAYLSGRDLLDLIHDFSLSGAPARDFVRILRRIPPRLYSISNSYQANPEEVDLTVVVLRYQAHERDRLGTCSSYCARQIALDDVLPVYVNGNPNFRMPADPNVPIIMVGAGTGVAPFRAFLEDREEAGISGPSWLFFGDRRFRTDFLYQLDWLRWRKLGVLTHMDVAFSRDTTKKVYVQHRMLRRSREIYDWLEKGAFFYVCGDEKRLAPDVHQTLIDIVHQEGGISPQQADEQDHGFVVPAQNAVVILFALVCLEKSLHGFAAKALFDAVNHLAQIQA